MVCEILTMKQFPGNGIWEQIINYEKAKRRLSFRLLNARAGEALCQKAVHFHFLDLVIVLDLILGENGGEQYRTYIPNELIEEWGVSRADVWKDAKENAARIQPACISDMESVIAQLLGELATMIEIEEGRSGIEHANGDKNLPVYVLTNRKGIYGAGCILYEGILKKISEHLQSDLLILPSSVHEILLLPYGEYSVGNLEEMVYSINREVVEAEKVLSDRVYRYCRRTEEIGFAETDRGMQYKIA